MACEEKKIIRFGIVGCGMIANVHAEALRSLEGVILAGVADARKESAIAFAQKYDITAYGSYEEMLADGEINAVCVCTPSGFHAENTLAALRAGKHVAVEKPIAMTVEEADAIIRTAKECEKLVTVISQMRFATDVIFLKDAIDAGKLGTLKMCDLYMKYWRDESYYQGSPWKGNRALDGGVLMNQGIHGVDLLRHLIGNATVAGSISDRLTHKIESPDTALALLRYDCGALGVIEASTATYPGFVMRLEIIGEHGYAHFLDNHLDKLVIDGEEVALPEEEYVSDGTAHDPTAVGFKKHALQLQNFVDSIHGEASLIVDAEAGRGAVALILDIYNEK